MKFPVHRRADVVENVRLARDTYRLRFHCPEMARTIRPGQFLMLRLPHHSDPLLGRPFALYDIAGDAIDIVYLVVGKVTGLMADLRAGDAVEVWGPLGNGFQPLATDDHVALVAGGIGQTPFMAYTRELVSTGKAKRVSLFYGVRTADLAAGVEDFRSAGAEMHLASDDGSLGYKGFVTELLAQHAHGIGHVVGCGPEPMLRALAKLTTELGIPCHLSLETPMACGLGICFSCVTKVKTADGWDYKRVCVDGPIFDACRLDL